MDNSVHLFYFARLKERFGCSEETLQTSARTVGELIAELRARGGVWDTELQEGRVFRVAVNQDMADLTTVLPNVAEVAIFPPVTGG